MTDEHAVRRLKSGDIGGLEELVLRYQVKAVRVAYLVSQDPSLAEDVVQETFLRLYQRANLLDEARPIEPYLMRSVVHAALNASRHKQRETILSDGHAFRQVEDWLCRAEQVEDAVIQSELREKVREVLHSLSPRQRAVIVQRYYLGMSEEEIRYSLAVAPGTVRWLLHEARQRLRRLLATKGGTE